MGAQTAVRWQREPVWSFVFVALLLAAQLCAGCRPSSRTSANPAATAWVLTFRQSNVYRLPAAELPASGSRGELRVGDRPLPFWRTETDAGPVIFFYAPVTVTRQSKIGALFWSTTVGAPSVRPRPLLFAEKRTTQTSAWHTVWREEDRLYRPRANLALPWFWAELAAPARWQSELALPPGARPYTLTLRLWSMTATAAQPDHRLRIAWDGVLLADEKWDGAGSRAWHVALPAAAGGTAGRHTLTLEAPGDTGAPVDVVFVDRWGVTYRQALDIRRQAVAWWAEAESVRLRVLPGRPFWLLDITSPLAPVAFGPAEPAGPWLTLPTTPGHRYWAGTVAQMASPTGRRPRQTLSTAALSALSAADEVVVGATDYLAAARPLIELRRAQGLKVATLTPRQLYDGWGRGVPDLAVWRQFLAWRAARSRPLRFLLLLGDADLLPWDGDLTALTTAVPTTFVRTPFLGETPSDAMLVATAAEPIAVGRMPVRSVAEVRAIVAKTMAYEKLSAPPRQLLLQDADSEFAPLADDIAAFWRRRGVTVTLFAAGGPTTRADLLNALAAGPAWLHYVGHGSPLLWSQRRVLTAADADRWHAPALVCAWTCLSGYFTLPGQRSLAERWLLSPQGGAVAVIAPAGEGTTEQERLFAVAFYRALLVDDRLGVALADARARPGQWEMGRQYLLFGDPALRISPAVLSHRSR